MQTDLQVRQTGFANLLLLPALAAALATDSAHDATAQTFKTLHNFTTLRTGNPCCNLSAPYINSDGAWPNAALVLSSDVLYGTTQYGGSGAEGTVFAVNTDGSGFTTLANFVWGTSDGYAPQAGLVLSGNTLYGTARSAFGGPPGTLFALDTDGSGLATLYSFTDQWAYPVAPLILSSGTLYGTTQLGGDANNGTVYALNTDGTGFTGGSDGTLPTALVISGNTLYGTALGNTPYGMAWGRGGSFDNGTVFMVNTDGTGFAVLHSFDRSIVGISPHLAEFFSMPINSDGAAPNSLMLSGNTLYGTTLWGGSAGYGTLFSISLPLSQPQLTISSVGATVILTWATNTTAFTLQSTTNLGSATIWTTNSSVPVVVNDQNTVITPISFTQQFFRLSQ